MAHPLERLSSVDGRYAKAVAALAQRMSEGALVRYRVTVKVAFIEHLADFPGVPVRPLTESEAEFLDKLVADFSLDDAIVIQQIERKGYVDGEMKLGPTNHDVQSVELWLQMKLRQTSMADLLPWLHFGRTSEDINSCAYALMLCDAISKVILPQLFELNDTLEKLSVEHAELPMLARTHGQSASPTTFGKEMRVFKERLERELNKLYRVTIDAKFSGATGNHNAEFVAFPNVDWPKFASSFIATLSRFTSSDPVIVANHYTTQIEPHDSYAELFQVMIRINNIVEDLAQDTWRYISDGWITQRAVASESGSSAMPHKVNPIDWENGEGNLELANALFELFARKLTKSRLQRDLSDSTVMRNFGIAFGWSLIAYKAVMRGLGKSSPNAEAMAKALWEHPEVITEAIQVILRREGVGGAYNILKDVARGKAVSLDDLRSFVATLDVNDGVKAEIMRITPLNYIGIAPAIARGEV